jgi:hypothetical protein
MITRAADGCKRWLAASWLLGLVGLCLQLGLLSDDLVPLLIAEEVAHHVKIGQRVVGRCLQVNRSYRFQLASLSAALPSEFLICHVGEPIDHDVQECLRPVEHVLTAPLHQCCGHRADVVIKVSPMLHFRRVFEQPELRDCLLNHFWRHQTVEELRGRNVRCGTPDVEEQRSGQFKEEGKLLPVAVRNAGQLPAMTR